MRKMWASAHRKLKLSHHRHSGRLLPHKHTSNGALVVIMLAVGMMLAVASRAIIVSAQTVTEQGSLDLSGTVQGPPPSTPAVIEQPKDGQVFTSKPIDISGTCPANVVVEIYKNNILAGSTLCVDGRFALRIDLIPGTNKLKAKVRDNLKQYGPDSGVITVYYKTGSGLVGLVIVPNSQYFGVQAGLPYRLELTIYGGRAPYAVDIDWGDGQHDLVSRSALGSFDSTHTYQQKRVYYLRISASDSLADKAYAETVVIVSLQTQAKPLMAKISTKPFLAMAWPLYASTLAAVAAFWLGEKYEEQKIDGEKGVEKSDSK